MVNTVENYEQYLPIHKDGSHFLTVRCEKVTAIKNAVAFHSPDEVKIFLNGIHGPTNPTDYVPIILKVTKELGGLNHEKHGGL